MDDLPHDAPLPLKRVCPSCGEEKDLTAKNFKPNRDGSAFWNPCKVCINKRDKKHARKRNQESPPVFDEHVPKKCLGPCQGSYPATLEYFYKADNKSGLSSRCKKCKAEYHHDHYFKDVEASRAYARAESARNYPTRYKRHGVKIRARRKSYYATHREVCREAIRTSKQKNKRKYQDLVNAWIRTHPEMIRVHRLARRARKKAVPGTHTAAQVREQLKRQKYRCYYAACGHAKFKKEKGKYVYHIEHTYPLSRVAGTDIPANDMSYLVLACPSCNLSKKDKYPWEWPEGGRLL